MRWLLYKRLIKNRASFSKEVILSIKGYTGIVILIGILGIVMAQADKMILSSLSPMQDFSFYMMAWVVASGLSRVTPLIQTFNPRLTELISKNDEEELAVQVRDSISINECIYYSTNRLYFIAN